jgi:hypothetical protein
VHWGIYYLLGKDARPCPSDQDFSLESGNDPKKQENKNLRHLNIQTSNQREEFNNLTPEEVDTLAIVAQALKSQRERLSSQTGS